MPPFDTKPDVKALPPKAIPDDRIEDVARAMVAAHPSGQNVPTEALDPAPLMNAAKEFVAAFMACTEIAKQPSKPKEVPVMDKAVPPVAPSPLAMPPAL